MYIQVTVYLLLQLLFRHIYQFHSVIFYKFIRSFFLFSFGHILKSKKELPHSVLAFIYSIT